MSHDERAGRGGDDAGDGVEGGGPHDEAFDRLRAADPAARSRVREGVLRAKVDDLVGPAALGAQAGAPAGADRPAGAGGGDEVGARRRRRAPWLAAAAVAVLAVGGGGYVLGSQTAAPGADRAGTAEPAVVLGGAPGAREDAGAEDAAGPAVADEAAGAAGSTADMAYPSWFEGRAVFRAAGLSTSGGEAEAYAVDPSEVATRAGAARVAAALGVEGEPRWEYGSWTIGAQDGERPSVWLGADGSATFGYQDPAADPWRCLEEGGDEPADDGRDPAAGCAEPSRATLSDDEARDALRDVMRAVGVDPGGFEIEVESEGGEESARWVTAHQVIDGRRTGAQWSASVGDAGIAWLDGFLGTTVALGRYPVVSPAEAVERLGDPRFAGSAWPVTFAEGADHGEMVEEPTEPTPPPAPPSPGDPVRWPVSEVEITGSRLGLTQHHQADGTVVVAPAYELSDADGNVWSVLAVADDAVDFAASGR